MPSFDIASKTDPQLLDNSINVAKKEIPAEWMRECIKQGEEAVDVKRFFK